MQRENFTSFVWERLQFYASARIECLGHHLGSDRERTWTTEGTRRGTE
jgi:hypothetical protein